ncbi:MAG: hypothetical protein K6G50_01570 [bacterium]|nr:hypothetical protein [bacterium]
MQPLLSISPIFTHLKQKCSKASLKEHVILVFAAATHLYATGKLTLTSGETASVTVDNFASENNTPESMDVTAESSSVAAGYSTQCEAKITYGNDAVETAA